MGLYYTLMTCMDFDHHHFCLSLNFLKFFFYLSFNFFLSSIIFIAFWLGFGLSLELGLGEGAIFLWGNCPRTVLTVGKQGDFLHDNEMLDFIHLVYVESCTFLYILNESN